MIIFYICSAIYLIAISVHAFFYQLKKEFIDLQKRFDKQEYNFYNNYISFFKEPDPIYIERKIADVLKVQSEMIFSDPNLMTSQPSPHQMMYVAHIPREYAERQLRQKLFDALKEHIEIREFEEEDGYEEYYRHYPNSHLIAKLYILKKKQ